MTGIIIKAQSRKTIRFFRAESLIFICFFKFIPHSPYSLDQLPVRADVFPQGLDVCVYGAGIPAVPVPPYGLKYRIFIVEDDETIANLLKKHLSSWGYDVFLAEDFSNILQEFAGKDPQLVLLDLKLPFYNGFHWCEEIRKVSQVPVIFISSAADNMNMVMAMSRGADDFIAKPFDMDVLVAKIQAILRRTYSFGNPGNVLEHKGAVLNLSRATLTWNGEETELTRNELRILELLFSQAGKPVSRDAIMTKLWESDSFVDDNTLTVNITRLRKKLEAAGLVDFIITRKGLGYMV